MHLVGLQRPEIAGRQIEVVIDPCEVATKPTAAKAWRFSDEIRNLQQCHARMVAGLERGQLKNI